MLIKSTLIGAALVFSVVSGTAMAGEIKSQSTDLSKIVAPMTALQLQAVQGTWGGITTRQGKEIQPGGVDHHPANANPAAHANGNSVIDGAGS